MARSLFELLAYVKDPRNTWGCPDDSTSCFRPSPLHRGIRRAILKSWTATGAGRITTADATTRRRTPGVRPSSRFSAGAPLTPRWCSSGSPQNSASFSAFSRFFFHAHARDANEHRASFFYSVFFGERRYSYDWNEHVSFTRNSRYLSENVHRVSPWILSHVYLTGKECRHIDTSLSRFYKYLFSNFLSCYAFISPWHGLTKDQGVSRQIWRKWDQILFSVRIRGYRLDNLSRHCLKSRPRGSSCRSESVA